METVQHANKSRKEALWTPSFITIIACILFTFMVGQSLNAGTTVYLERVGGTAALAGIGALAFSFSAGFIRLFCGGIIDAKGRQIVMLAGSCIALLGSIGPLISNYGFLFITWRILQGIGFSASSTAATTAVADILPFSRLGEGIGYSGIGQALSMATGPALAVFLATSSNPNNFYYGIIVAAVIALILALACRYEKHPEKLPYTSQFRIRSEKKQEQEALQRKHDASVSASADNSTPEAKLAAKEERSFLKNLWHAIFEPAALKGAIVMLFLATVFAFNTYFMGAFGISLQIQNAGFYYMVCACTILVIRLVSGRFMDTVKPIKNMAFSVVSGIIAMVVGIMCVLNLFPNTTVAFYLMGIPYGFCLGVGMPVNQTITMKLSPPERWGAASGLLMLSLDISNGIASLLWGFLISSCGFIATLIGCIITLVLSFVSALAVYPKK